MSIFSPGFFLLLTKISFLTVDLMFTIFLGVVFRQVVSMNTVVDDTNDSLILKSIIFSLFMLALSLFLTGLVIL